MRILSIHADSMWYHATKKTKIAEEITIKEDRMEECVVLFCCVERIDEKNPGYVVENATKNVLLRLAKIKVTKVLIFPYAHLTSSLGEPGVSLAIIRGLHEALADRGIEVKRAPFGWYKQFDIRAKGHPLADLSMTICPYEGTECDFTCPYCNHPIKQADVKSPCAAAEVSGGMPEGKIRQNP